jgi:hypothetical protein
MDTEYEERGFRNRTLYIRRILDQRDAIFETDGTEIDAADRLADHDERLESAEERLDALEKQAHTHSSLFRS